MNTKETWEEEYLKTKFSRGGGSCFECCDYEGMDTDMRAFIAAQVQKAKLEGMEEFVEKYLPEEGPEFIYLSPDARDFATQLRSYARYIKSKYTNQ